jgi:hypothetical protein
MDIERFQAIEKQLAEQAEANRITNENLANLFKMMSARESQNVVPLPPAPRYEDRSMLGQRYSFPYYSTPILYSPSSSLYICTFTSYLHHL